MSCDDIRATLIEALAAGRAPADPAVIAHVESCPACRAAREDYERLWKELGSLAMAAPSPDARERFDRRFAAARLASPHPTARTPLGLLGVASAAALVVALAGYYVGVRRAPDRVAVVQSDSVKGRVFLLLLHEDSAFRRGEPSMPRGALAAEYARWANRLPGGAYVRSAPLVAEPGVWLGAPHGPVGPGDYVDGYFLIRADNMAAAQQIAATCPHLKHGGRIEVHEIDRALNQDSP